LRLQTQHDANVRKMDCQHWKDLNSKNASPIWSLIRDYKIARPDEVAALTKSFEDADRLRKAEAHARRLHIEASRSRAICAAREAIEGELLARAVPSRSSTMKPTRQLLPEALTIRDDGSSMVPLPLQLRRCLAWLCCPEACTLALLAPAAVAEVMRLPSHGRRCPFTRRCGVCGAAFTATGGTSTQAARLAAHRRRCAPWEVDGRLWRHFFAGNPTLRAGEAGAAVRAAIQEIDATDFPGASSLKDGTTDRTSGSSLAQFTLVCCPQFGCDEMFCSRDAALEHASRCLCRQATPPFSSEELFCTQARFVARMMHPKPSRA